jgi:hypothetical protein
MVSELFNDVSLTAYSMAEYFWMESCDKEKRKWQ